MMRYAKNLSMWVGGFALLVGTISLAKADEKGEKIMREALRKLNAAQSMTAKFTQTSTADNLPFKLTLNGTVSLMKPNSIHVRIAGEIPKRGKVERVYASVGADYITYFGTEKLYRKDRLEPKPQEFTGEWEAELDGFFGGEELMKRGKANYKGTDKVGTIPCDVITFTSAPRNNLPERVMTYYIGQKDRLIHRATYPVPSDSDSNLVQTNLLTEINLSAKLSAKDFVYTLPAGAKPIIQRRQREILQRNDSSRGAF